MRIWTCNAGTFSGYETKTCYQIRGIRYASSKRYEKPIPYVYEPGVHSCVDPSPMSIQCEPRLAKMLTGSHRTAIQQREDCQYLSITVPKQSEETPLPVMVWFHGGSYRNGGCDQELYERQYLAGEQKVIVVGVNYRLGILGFGRDKSGGYSNLGLYDAIEGLRWVHDNISGFGGDPENITIFGQSAGGDLSRCIMLAEDTESLYRRSIIQSDPLGAMEGREALEQQVLEELKELPDDADAEDIRSAEQRLMSHIKEKGYPKYMVFAPHFGTAPLPSVGDISRRIEEIASSHDLMIGTTTREVSVYGAGIRPLYALDRFSLTEGTIESIISKLSSDIFTAPTEQLAKDYAMAGGNTFLYSFFWRENNAFLGAGHTSDLLVLFGAKYAAGNAIAMGLSEEEIIEKGKPIRKIWADFARSGTPGTMNVPGMIRIDRM